jgi:hypothetical protein
MPNHVKNRVVTTKQVSAKLLGEHEGKPVVDFKRIIPLPKGIRREGISSHVKCAAELALGLVECKKEFESYDRGEAFELTVSLEKSLAICVAKTAFGNSSKAIPKGFLERRF